MLLIRVKFSTILASSQSAGHEQQYYLMRVVFKQRLSDCDEVAHNYFSNFAVWSFSAHDLIGFAKNGIVVAIASTSMGLTC